MAAIDKRWLRTLNKAGSIETVQTITNSTATQITNYGVTVLTSTLGSTGTTVKNWIMARPVKGINKSIMVDPNSTGVVQIVNYSTTVTYFGTTGNALTFSTGAGTKKVHLVGLSSAVWGITAQSTGVTVAATTVSA